MRSNGQRGCIPLEARCARPSAHAAGVRLPAGFTVVELLVVITIAAMLAVVAIAGFRNFVHHERLETAAQDLYTALSEARSATLASEQGQQYGVRIEDDRLIRFRGSSYNAADSANQITYFPGVTATTTLSGGPTIIFARQTGEASSSGTIRLTHAVTLASTTLSVSASGLISASE